MMDSTIPRVRWIAAGSGVSVRGRKREMRLVSERARGGGEEKGDVQVW